MGVQFDKTGERLFYENARGCMYLAKRIKELDAEATAYQLRWLDFHEGKKDNELSPEELQERELQRIGVDFIEEWKDAEGNLKRRAIEVKYEPATLYKYSGAPDVVKNMAAENAEEGENADPHGTGNYFIELRQWNKKGEELPGWYEKARNNSTELKEKYGITHGRVFAMLSIVKAKPRDFIVATFIEDARLFQLVDSLRNEGKLCIKEGYPDAEQKKSGICKTEGALLPIPAVFTEEHLQRNRIDLSRDGRSIRLITAPENGAFRMRFENEEYFECMEKIREADLREKEQQ